MGLTPPAVPQLLNMFGFAYQIDRAGIRRWSRLEASCAAPDGEVKFVLGPICWRSEPCASGVLMAWQSSYRSKVARTNHPEDYDYASIDGKALALRGNWPARRSGTARFGCCEVPLGGAVAHPGA